MRISSTDTPCLATLVSTLFILQSAITVQGRTRHSLETDGISDPINLPESLRIVPRQLSPKIEFRMVPHESSQPKVEDREASTDHLADRMPDGWRVIPRQMEPPRIEMQLMKGHVPKTGANWISLEYQFSDNNGNAEPKMSDRNNANKIDGNKGSQNKTNSNYGLGSRTIFQVPLRPCPPGERRDPWGKCRKIY